MSPSQYSPFPFSKVIQLAPTYPLLLSGEALCFYQIKEFLNSCFSCHLPGCILAGTSVGIIKPATGLYISEVTIFKIVNNNNNN